MTREIWFTSDTHFGHVAINEYCNRGFMDVLEMNTVLTKIWNRVIHPKDTVYHLGDFGFGNTKTLTHFISALNGRLHLIRGNHDYRWNATPFTLFDSVSDIKEIKIDGQKIVLCHFPLLAWNGSHRGSWSLHGHSHGQLPYTPAYKRLDVGVDVHNFHPVHFETIRSIFNCLTTYEYKLRY